MARGTNKQTAFYRISNFTAPFLIALLLIGTLYAVRQLKSVQFFPIRTVEVYGAKHVDPNEIQTMLTPLVEHGYFATNLALIRDRLRQLSWVRDIAARRSWPELLSIVLIEKKPLAQMSGGGLLSEEGEVFFPDPKTYPENLPIFSGPAGKQVLMLEHYKNINRIITPLHAKIIYIELTSYEEWIVSLDNGITLHLGQHDILTRLMHFVNVYHKIIGDHAQDVDYVDLRYSNGVAVKRKMSV